MDWGFAPTPSPNQKAVCFLGYDPLPLENHKSAQSAIIGPPANRHTNVKVAHFALLKILVWTSCPNDNGTESFIVVLEKCVEANVDSLY